MLTVWRKLHVEVDSMEAVPTSGPEANIEAGTIALYAGNSPAAGRSTISPSLRLKGGENAYQNGSVVIDGIGTFKVLGNTLDVSGENPVESVVIDGVPGADIVGKSFTIQDDDDMYLSTLGLPPALPKDGESANWIQEIRDVYFPGCIDIVDANAEGLNPNRRIPFKLNEEIGLTGSPFDAKKDVYGNSYFWAHTVTFGYQTMTSEDGDPDTEDPTLGITPKKSILYPTFQAGISVIYVETIRDVSLRSINVQNPATFERERLLYVNAMAGNIAHEMGHAPGGQSADADHAEEGIMVKGGLPLHDGVARPARFAPATVKRFRKALQWSE